MTEAVTETVTETVTEIVTETVTVTVTFVHAQQYSTGTAYSVQLYTLLLVFDGKGTPRKNFAGPLRVRALVGKRSI